MGVSRLALEHVPRALAARDTRGFVKLVADAGSRKIIGAHILAAEAGEMVTEPALAIKFGLTIEDLTSTFHPYLTLSEGIKLAAQTFDKDVGQLSCCAASGRSSSTRPGVASGARAASPAAHGGIHPAS